MGTSWIKSLQAEIVKLNYHSRGPLCCIHCKRTQADLQNCWYLSAVLTSISAISSTTQTGENKHLTTSTWTKKYVFANFVSKIPCTEFFELLSTKSDLFHRISAAPHCTAGFGSWGGGGGVVYSMFGLWAQHFLSKGSFLADFP